jgi:hypothetical protein
VKKLLVITYYWPPAGGINVLRCLKLVKYLRNFGWEPIIFTASGADYPRIDLSNLEEIPNNLEIHRVKILEPYSLYRKFRGLKSDFDATNVLYSKDEKAGLFHQFSVWIRSNFFIPDARALWIKPSVKYLLKYLKEHKVDAIFSNGPPHTNTRIATLIKKQTGIPWLADFQDPWTQVDYFKKLILTSSSLKKHSHFEQEVFKNANKITIVSESWKRDLEAIGAKDVGVIYYGYDPDDYNSINKAELPDKFVIVHSGLLGEDRLPSDLLNILADKCRKDENFRNALQLEFLGQVDHQLISLIAELGLTNQFQFRGFIPRKEVLEINYNSQIQLLCLNKQQNAAGRIPGKLFEYLACRTPILCLGEPDGDAAKIVNDCEAGVSIAYDDLSGLSAFIDSKWQDFLAGTKTITPLEKINSYSVVTQVEKFSKYLDEISSKTYKQ